MKRLKRRSRDPLAQSFSQSFFTKNPTSQSGTKPFFSPSSHPRSASAETRSAQLQRSSQSSGTPASARSLTRLSASGGSRIMRAACPTRSCPGIAPNMSNCSAYLKNAWWLPMPYVINATFACLETPNSPTANCVRKTLQDRLARTPSWLKTFSASQKAMHILNPGGYQFFVQSFITPRVYADHVAAYRTAGCPAGPAPYLTWSAVTTIPMPPGTVGIAIRYGGGSCSGTRGRWC